MKKKTMLIHGGIPRDQETGAVSFPIHHASTFKQEGIGNFSYEYGRTGNPTRNALEKLIADLEEGERGFAFASGMAAISSVFGLFKSGDHIVITDDVYGGTFRLITRVLSNYNIEATFVDTSNLEEVKGAFRESTVAIFLETPTNPLLKITDIKAISEVTKSHGLLLIVDNTFATPYWQNPLTIGANIVIHSATKYIGGHSDVVAGLVVVDNAELGERIHFIQNAVGAVLGPQDSWLLIRGLRTLGIRMEEIEQSTKQIVSFLNQHSSVVKIYYPGLEGHKGKEIHEAQAGGFGGMISFDVGSIELADKVLRETEFFTLAESLGAVESLISLPARMTHASIPPERRSELGITGSLVRISVGLEDVEDLIADLKAVLG